VTNNVDSQSIIVFDGEVVHTFNDQNTIKLYRINIQCLEASRIEKIEEINIVFFKMNLSTGWDCHCGEVTISFRRAQDYIYIAQLLSRMVRTLLARRIQSDAELNNVCLFLHYYDEKTVSSVIGPQNISKVIVLTETGT